MGKEITLTVRDVNSRGQGVAVGEDGKVVFLDGGLPSEIVRVSLETEKKNYATAKVLNVEVPSEHRITPRCPWYGLCGGCQLQHGSYDLQLEIKAKSVKDAMERIGRMKVERPICHPSPIQWGYRNKASFPVRSENGGEIGFFRSGSHKLVPIDGCPVLMPHVEKLYVDFRNRVMPELKRDGVPFYDERRHKGLLRHMVIRGNRGGSLLALAVVTSLRDCRGKELLERSLARLKETTQAPFSGVWNENPSRGNRILGERSSTIWGEGVMSEKISNYDLSYDGTAFFQVNPFQAERLFLRASSIVAERGGAVVELYAGVGALTVVLAKAAKTVLAVEEWAPAIEGLLKNVSRNGLDNVKGICNRAEDTVRTMVEAQPDVIVVDPPRGGCASEVLDAVTESSADTLVYVSCNPSTLARDGAKLVSDGWELTTLECFDLFPQTVHVETLASFKRIARG
ncbi:23S rRNA (uracil(1939)-C(5))-methyltransferase RlmD [Dethiosulfovibrio sp. F2B]|uniref:23S rRNA (uracil(1939)-C(5))-methyltransferase RlmD n=1 Tax=Dethiosulfovibrio faecalis TaxID=2720018 RepID=UPI001F2E2145|nr:23S rRNA (uracil(1939)-C(5))-methyltransferase RlmD [Dethiosulfovibrio faecalis]